MADIHRRRHSRLILRHRLSLRLAIQHYRFRRIELVRQLSRLRYHPRPRNSNIGNLDITSRWLINASWSCWCCWRACCCWFISCNSTAMSFAVFVISTSDESPERLVDGTRSICVFSSSETSYSAIPLVSATNPGVSGNLRWVALGGVGVSTFGAVPATWGFLRKKYVINFVQRGKELLLYTVNGCISSGR